MKKRWRRKGSKVIAAAADWQAPPRWRKLDDVSQLPEIWADWPPGGPESCDDVERSAVEDES